MFDDDGNVLAGGDTSQAGDFADGTVAKLAPNGALLWKWIDERGSEVRSLDVVSDGDGLLSIGSVSVRALRSSKPIAARVAGRRLSVMSASIAPAFSIGVIGPRIPWG